MERLHERLALSERALTTLEAVPSLHLPPDAERDIAIMRFIYTFQALWRALQRYLAVVEGVDTGTPKACLRGAHKAGLLSREETQQALVMVDDRNLTVHTYNESLARAIWSRMPGHIEVMRVLLGAMRQRTGSERG